MAERSKAPDSSFKKTYESVFWSVYTGVGSNPTAVKFFFFHLIFFVLRLGFEYE
jgi:hypothetical protein